jgi:hypothetical protein
MSLRAAVRRHRALVSGMGAVVVGFLAYGVAIGSDSAIAYPVIVTLGGALVAAVEPPGGYSRVVLAGLSLWAVGHLAGGIVDIGDDRVLYNAVLPGRLHFDNVVHFVGFGAAGLTWFEAVRPRNAVWTSTWLAGMGVGAFNEVLEFVWTLVDEDSNVGGYRNTGRDLIANMLGSAVAASVAARRLGDDGAWSSPSSDPGRPRSATSSND